MKTTLFTLAIVFAFVSQAQIVNIPDANLKTALLNYTPVIDLNSDGEIQVSEAEAYTGWGSIQVNGLGIVDMTGIEYFISIESLNCHSNNIEILDVSNNTALNGLNCGENNIYNLTIGPNVSTLTCEDNWLSDLGCAPGHQFYMLSCSNNMISSLDLSNSEYLDALYCGNNEITTLNLDNNPNLQTLECSSNNMLTELSIKNGNNTNILDQDFYVENNPNLTCIEVDDETWATANWTNIDAQASFSNFCSFTITETHTSESCGLFDASIDITVYAGTPPYDFDWVGPNGFVANQINALDFDISGLEAGTYNLTVTDGNSDIETLSVIVTETDPIEVAVIDSSTINNCFGECNAYFEVSATGGIPPYQYVWNNLESDVLAETLCAGDYLVTVTDATGCQAVSQVMTVEENPEIVITPAIINNLCAGDTLGSIDITVTGGSPSYNYAWPYPLNLETEDVENLSAGSYCVTVTDFMGCAIAECFTITAPVELIISSSNIINTTNGVCNGSVEVTTTGGISPYAPYWSNGDNAWDIYNLCSGIYEFTILDSFGCEAQEDFEVGSSYDGVYTFVDTLNPVIDTCIFDNTNPVDSALIYDYNLVGADSIQLNWIFWQAGVSITLDMTVFLETTGSNLVCLEIICNGSKSINSATTYNFYGMFDTQTIGIKESENSSLSVYPNPTTGKITIKSPNVEEIEIYNLSGVLIKSTNNKEIDLSQEAKGIYFVKVMTKKNIETTKLIIE